MRVFGVREHAWINITIVDKQLTHVYLIQCVCVCVAKPSTVGEGQQIRNATYWLFWAHI